MDRAEFFLGNLRGKILDVGYNCGPLHRRILEKFGRQNVYGVDTETRKEAEHYKKGSAEEMPFTGSSFDSVVAGELIEHLQNPEKFLQESNRLLKEKGLIFISTPNRESLINRLTHSYNTPVHLNLFNRKELFLLLEKNAFKVERFFCQPYNAENSYGTKQKWSFFFRGILHYFLPQSLQEEMVLMAKKVKEI